jgi:hypothetical protein
MSTQAIRTHFRTRDFSSERAMRRGSAHRRTATAPAVAPAVALVAASTPVPAARQAAPTVATGARILRRWSVAQLIAHAAAGPRLVA